MYHGLNAYKKSNREIVFQNLLQRFMKELLIFSNHVYMGDVSVKPRKTQLDKMFEKIMQSTGHDHMWKIVAKFDLHLIYETDIYNFKDIWIL